MNKIIKPYRTAVRDDGAIQYEFKLKAKPKQYSRLIPIGKRVSPKMRKEFKRLEKMLNLQLEAEMKDLVADLLDLHVYGKKAR